MFRIKGAIAASIMAISSMALPAMADTKDFDWVVNMKTEVQKGVLDFRGSKYKNPVKVRISYYEGEKGEDSKTEYEDMWFGEQGKPLGQEKFHEYKIRKAEQTIIKVKEQKDPFTEKECDALGNAILRFYLDATLKGTWVTAIRVPPSSYENILNYFLNHNFTQYQNAPPDVAGEATKKVKLFMAEDTPQSGRKTYLVRN